MSTRYKHRASVLRYAAMVVMMMCVGVNSVWGATITYHIINLGRLDNNGALTSDRTEALQFTSTSTTVGVPDQYKSPLAKTWKYYTSDEITVNAGSYTFAASTTLVEGTSTLSDGDHVYVTYELDEDKFREVGIYNRGIYRIKFPNDYYLMQDTWNNNGTIEVNTNPGTDPTTNTNRYLWKFNIIDPYQITVQSQSGSYKNWYLCSKSGNFGDIRLNATISGAKATDVWVFGLLNGGTDTYRLVVTDGFKKNKNENKCDDFGHGYLNSNYKKGNNYKTTYQQYYDYGKNSYLNCDLTFEPVTKNYIIVNNSGEPIVQALTEEETLVVPDVIKSPLASYTYYGTQQDAIDEGTQLSSATGATIYVRYTTNNVLNLSGEIKYNISVGGSNYLYAADATTLSSEATSENNSNNNHKWILTGNDAYQITIKNVGNSNEIAYNLSSSEAVSLSGTGSKFFLHEGNNGGYEVVAITSNDYSTPDYYTLGLDAGALKLYSNSSHEFGDTEVQTVFTPRAMATITTPPAANSLTYNGSNQNLVTAGSASNGTMKYRIGDTGSYETSIPVAKDVNTYNVYYMASGADSYEDFVASEPIEVTINKQSITVSGITAGNKTYDGNPTASLVYTGATLTGNFDGENLTISATGTFDNKNVGNDKTVTISDLTLGGTAVGNYELAASGQQTSTTADIAAKDVTASGTIAASNKVYDGTTTAVFDYSGVTLSGKVEGDNLSVTATGTFADKNVGTGKTVTINDWALSGTDVGNYNLASSNVSATTTASITPAEITVSGITAENKVYNSTTAATLDYSGVTFTGKVDGDVLSVTATGAFADANVGTGKTVNISGLALGGADTGNYTLAESEQQTSTTASITPATLTVTANDISVTYGSAEPEYTFIYSGFVNSESAANLTTQPTATCDYTQASNVGTYVISLSGGEATNYSFSYIGGTLSVNPKAVTITANNASKNFDGTALTESGFTTTALEAGDGHTFTVTMTDESTITNVGSTSNVIASVDGTAVTTGTATSVGNYTVTTENGTLTVNAKIIGSGSSIELGFSLEVGVNNTIILNDGESTLTQGIDYTIIESNSGKYSSKTISGTGNYAGTFSIRNAIVTFQPDANSSEWSATFVAENAAGTGSNDSNNGHALPDGVKAYIITSIEDSWAITEELNYIPEGIPVLLVSDNASGGFKVEDASAHTAITSTQISNNMLEVTNSSTHFDAKSIYLLHNNEFVYNMAGDLAAGKVYLNPNHSTPSSPAPAPARLSIMRSPVTGIDRITDDGNKEIRNDGQWYSIDGRRLNGTPTREGLYFHDGMKVLIK